MKTHKFSVAIILSLFTLLSNAQAPKVGYLSRNNFFDVAAGAGSGIFVGSISWTHLHPIGKKKQRFNIGYGVRFSSAFASNLDYTTAPAKLTSNDQGPQVLFGESFNENIDTLKIKSTQINSLNLTINLQYNFTPKFAIGTNIDAVGISFGGKTTGTFQSSISVDNQTSQTASPTTLNALLISDNDFGSLNSEWYAKYSFNEKIGLRAGYQFYFTEYTTDKKLSFDNDRFRAKHPMAFVSLTYHFIR